MFVIVLSLLAFITTFQQQMTVLSLQLVVPNGVDGFFAMVIP